MPVRVRPSAPFFARWWDAASRQCDQGGSGNHAGKLSANSAVHHHCSRAGCGDDSHRCDPRSRHGWTLSLPKPWIQSLPTVLPPSGSSVRPSRQGLWPLPRQQPGRCHHLRNPGQKRRLTDAFSCITGDQSDAARLIGISQASKWYQMKEYKLNR